MKEYIFNPIIKIAEINKHKIDLVVNKVKEKQQEKIKAIKRLRQQTHALTGSHTAKRHKSKGINYNFGIGSAKKQKGSTKGITNMILKPGHIITEGVEGYWYYHISREDNFTQSLCGKQTMTCSLPESAWGIKGHLNEKYCQACANKMVK